MKTRWTILGAMAVGALFVHCKGEVLHVGAADGEAPLSSSGASGGSATATVWTGYFENLRLRSGSDRLALTFVDSSRTTGTAFFGDPPALPPPTDPNVAYPPENALAAPGRVSGAGSQWEKFSYSLLNVSASDSGRLTFDVEPGEVFKDWCELQRTISPLDNPDGGAPRYTCSLDRGWEQNCGTGLDAGVHAALCNQSMTCGVACTCTATRCTAALSRENQGTPLHFDLSFNGDTASGSVLGVNGGLGAVPVHLTRQ
jgi:hypothetical protein